MSKKSIRYFVQRKRILILNINVLMEQEFYLAKICIEVVV